MDIKHLVISGAGQQLFQLAGAIAYLMENNIINKDNLKTIHATSAGALLSFLCILNFDKETTFDFLIKRPWNEVFNITVEKILGCWDSKGLFSKSELIKSIHPLYKAKNLPFDITLSQFYNDYGQVEIHFFTFEINSFELKDISYLTHPNLQLIDAIYMTCAIPIFFTPLFLDGKCYIDGAMICNYPMKQCIENGYPKENILGIQNYYDYGEKFQINSESKLLDFIYNFLNKLLLIISEEEYNYDDIKQIQVPGDSTSVFSLQSSFNDKQWRINSFEMGYKFAQEYLINNTKK